MNSSSAGSDIVADADMEAFANRSCEGPTSKQNKSNEEQHSFIVAQKISKTQGQSPSTMEKSQAIIKRHLGASPSQPMIKPPQAIIGPRLGAAMPQPVIKPPLGTKPFPDGSVLQKQAPFKSSRPPNDAKWSHDGAMEPPRQPQAHIKPRQEKSLSHDGKPEPSPHVEPPQSSHDVELSTKGITGASQPDGASQPTGASQLDAIMDIVKGLQQQVGTVESRCDDLEKKNKILEENNKKLQEDNKKLQEDNKKLQESDIRKNKVLNELQKNIKSLKGDNADLKVRVDVLEFENSVQESRICGLEAKNATVDNRANKFESAYEKSEARATSATKVITSNFAETSDLRAQVGDSEKKIAVLESDAAEMRKTMVGLVRGTLDYHDGTFNASW
jgi:hypothetical protein